MSSGYKKALERFEAAVREHAFIGAQHPDDHLHIQTEYEEAKAALVTKLSYRQLKKETDHSLARI